MIRHSMLLRLAIPLALMSPSAHAWQDQPSPWVFDLPKGGTSCTQLPTDQSDIRYDVNFNADIQPLIGNFCMTCHVNSSSGGFNVSAASARATLIGPNETGTPSQGDPSRLRVRPFFPAQSMFFVKLNCAAPPFGGRMPPGSDGESTLAFQKLVHDWIASGALMPDSPGGDRLSIGSFESITRPSPAP